MKAGKLQEIQKRIAKEVTTTDAVQDIKYIAAFDTAYIGNKVVCGAVVIDAETMEVVEKKYSVSRAALSYIPGLLAFREGPPILQTYYDLEHDPDVLMIKGHGIAHPLKCGLATYVGVELAKPTIGMAKKLLTGGEAQDGKVLVDGEQRGIVVKTKEHANPLFVSPGTMISIETAAKLVEKTVIPPHKLPEPMHIAHRFTKHMAAKLPADKLKELAREEEPELTEQS